MIPRYSRPAMRELWGDEQIFGIRLEVELAVAQAQAELGYIPENTALKFARIFPQIKYDAAAIAAIEERTRHDVTAMLQYVSGFLGDDAAYLHYGMTSSDLIDTALCLQLQRAGKLILQRLSELAAVLHELAHRHKHTYCIGRSHGMHAEPTSFGLKLAGYYAEFMRAQSDVERALQQTAVCAISGAVGTYSQLAPSLEEQVAARLGMKVETISTQIIPRDRFARLITSYGLLAGSIERLAIEIRHLQRSEVAEVAEAFGTGQQGSSAMPHKRNPVLSENLTGIARLLRSYCLPILENIALWHERDISHSANERIIFPDSHIILDFALHRLTELLRNLEVNPEKMLANLESSGGIYNSQRIMLALVNPKSLTAKSASGSRGISKTTAYELVQACAHHALQQKISFRQVISQNTQIQDILNPDQLAELFDLKYYLRHIDSIFKRVFPQPLSTTAQGQQANNANRL